MKEGHHRPLIPASKSVVSFINMLAKSFAVVCADNDISSHRDTTNIDVRLVL